MTNSYNRTVILLGSGASTASDFRLPTMRGFFDNSVPANLRVFLAWFYQHSNYDEYNLEDVLVYLELTKTRVPMWGYGEAEGDKFDSSVTYDYLLNYVQDRLAITENGVCNLHKQLFDGLQIKDTIISLNYDLIGDNGLRFGKFGSEPTSRIKKLWDLVGNIGFWGGTPPVLTHAEQEQGFYIKLHGSLDWLRCPTPACPNNLHISCIGKLEGMSLKAGMPCRFCGAALQIYIIPPIATKRLEERSRMGFLWHLALKELASAEHIVVIGLSFAPTDFELRWLIKLAMQLRKETLRQLTVVDKAVSQWVANNTWFVRQASKTCSYDSLTGYLAKGGLISS